MLFHRFFNFYCLFRQRFSAAYLIKLFRLPQRVHNTLCIRCDKHELTRWCLCSLHAGIQMSPGEVVASRDGCRHWIAESTIDELICLFWKVLTWKLPEAFGSIARLASCYFFWLFCAHSLAHDVMCSVNSNLIGKWNFFSGDMIEKLHWQGNNF